jgi:hypothetical protein
VKAAVKVIALALGHFVLSTVAFLLTFSRTMERFDGAAEATLIDGFGSAAVSVLWFPFLPIARMLGVQGGGPAEWCLFAANSVLWGVALYSLITVLRRRFLRRTKVA